MDPLDDRELGELLQQWKAPVTPPHLRPSLPRRPWYTALWTTSVRIPVPLLALLLILVAVLQLAPGRKAPQTAPADARELRLSDFQPVPEATPVVIRKAQYEPTH